MAKDLIVSGTPYTFPDQGGNPPWGSEVTEWATAVTDTLSGFVSDTDIINGTATIVDNISSPANISGFDFDITKVRGFVAEYSIYRASATPKSETGILMGNYNGTTWTLSRQATDDCGVTFTITSAGQIQYTSTSVGSLGTLKFSAKTKTQ